MASMVTSGATTADVLVNDEVVDLLADFDAPGHEWWSAFESAVAASTILRPAAGAMSGLYRAMLAREEGRSDVE
jgi:hypothetical protein